MTIMKRVLSVLLISAFMLSLPFCALASDYSDVSGGAWFEEAVDYVTERGLMDGMSEDQFAPNDNAPRGTVAEALWRMAGRPEASGHASFTDVLENNPNRAAIDWAAEAGVINGYPDGTFGSDDLVTREQFAAMMWRAVGSPDSDTGSGFADSDTILPYAVTAADWAQVNGIITGMPGNLFAPKANISRAMVATILMRYDKMQNTDEGSKVLVAYFSYTGSTEKIAGYISDALGAELYRIVPEEAYTDDILSYYDKSTRAYIEQYDDSARPAISGTVGDMDEYDIVFVGYPIWYGKAPKIIYTFLESYDFTGKTLVPFCTSGSSGINNSELRSAAPGADWLNGSRFSSSASSASVANWVNGLGLDIASR